MPDSRPDVRQSLIVTAICLPLVLLLLHAWSFMPFISDDSLISLRYAERLLMGKGLSWNDDFPVEGYSNLAWVLLVAALGYLGADLIDAVRILGVLCTLAVLLANYNLWHNRLQGVQRRYLVIAQCAFALNGGVAIWAIGGLEQPLVIACTSLALLLLVRASEQQWAAGYILAASFFLGVLCLSRPDSPLICLAFALAVFHLRGINLRALAGNVLLAVFPLLMLGGQLWFRLQYYGEWVPNTALIKLTPSLHYVLVGLAYLLAGFLFCGPLAYFSLKSLFRPAADAAAGNRSIRVFVSYVLVCWCAYILVIGGDIFPGFRHLVIVTTLLVMALPLLAQAQPAIPVARLRWLAVLYVVLQLVNPMNILGHLERWEWNGAVIGKVLKTAFHVQQPLIAADAGGMFPYFTGFPAIDMLGLNDYHIARTQPKPTNSWYVGHAFSDGEYVLGRAPDLVDFCYNRESGQACLNSGRELLALDAFRQQYHYTYLKGYDPHELEYPLWFRVNSEKVGMVRKGRQLSVPAYFLVSERPVVAALNEHGRLAVSVAAGTLYRLAYVDAGEVLAVKAVPDVAEIRLVAGQDGTADKRGISLEFLPKAGSGENLQVERLELELAAEPVSP